MPLNQLILKYVHIVEHDMDCKFAKDGFNYTYI